MGKDKSRSSVLDFVRTIKDDETDNVEVPSSSANDLTVAKRQLTNRLQPRSASSNVAQDNEESDSGGDELAPDFLFTSTSEPMASWDFSKTKRFMQGSTDAGGVRVLFERPIASDYACVDLRRCKDSKTVETATREAAKREFRLCAWCVIIYS
jgi:hypothetical protein